jgi:hypothetical protein
MKVSVLCSVMVLVMRFYILKSWFLWQIFSP